MAEEIKFHFKEPKESSGFLLWQTTMLWQRKMKKELDIINITHTQFVLMAALAWLSRNKEDVTQVDVANHSNTDRMMVSKVLRKLEDKNLISRREHETDTRAKIIDLTIKGETTLKQALKIVQKVDEDFFSKLQKETRNFNSNMITLLEKNQT